MHRHQGALEFGSTVASNIKVFLGQYAKVVHHVNTTTFYGTQRTKVFVGRHRGPLCIQESFAFIIPNGSIPYMHVTFSIKRKCSYDNTVRN